MKALPPLPKDTVRRVVRVARFDGWSVLGVAGVLALAAATMGDYVGAIVGLIVAGAGAGELHGASLLSHGEVRGLKWLIGSQLFLMAAIVSYCALRLLHPDLAPLRALIDAEMKAQLAATTSALEEKQRQLKAVLDKVATLQATCDETLTGTEITDAAAVEAVEVAARERVEDGKVAAVVVEPRA